MEKVTEILFFIFTGRRKYILEEIQRLEIKKRLNNEDIPSRNIKDIFGDYLLLSSFNDAIDKFYFPAALKQANITLVFKRGERYSTDNYRPISILPNVSKSFEKCMFCQMSHYMDNFLSKHRSSSRKGCNAPYPVGIYMFKVNNRNTRARCKIFSKLTIMSLLLTLNIFHTLF